MKDWIIRNLLSLDLIKVWAILFITGILSAPAAFYDGVFYTILEYIAFFAVILILWSYPAAIVEYLTRSDLAIYKKRGRLAYFCMVTSVTLALFLQGVAEEFEMALGGWVSILYIAGLGSFTILAITATHVLKMIHRSRKSLDRITWWSPFYFIFLPIFISYFFPKVYPLVLEKSKV